MSKMLFTGADKGGARGGGGVQCQVRRGGGVEVLENSGKRSRIIGFGGPVVVWVIGGRKE